MTKEPTMTTTDTDTKPTLHVFGDDCEWVIAESLGDAWKVLREHGYGDPENDCAEWEQESDTKRMTCRIGVDGRPANPDEDGGDETMTCAEWAARLGRGYFCTTES